MRPTASPSVSLLVCHFPETPQRRDTRYTHLENEIGMNLGKKFFRRSYGVFETCFFHIPWWFLHFLEVLENVEILEILENPQTVESKGESDHYLDILEWRLSFLLQNPRTPERFQKRSRRVSEGVSEEVSEGL